MKRNSYITHLLIILFLFSTTGMPVVLHHCSSMQATSLVACEMHSQKEQEESCCEEEEPAAEFYSTSKDDCCSDILVDESIKESFVSGTKDVQVFQTISHHSSELNDIPLLRSEILQNSFSNYLPPGKIYLINSVFLI